MIGCKRDYKVSLVKEAQSDCAPTASVDKLRSMLHICTYTYHIVVLHSSAYFPTAQSSYIDFRRCSGKNVIAQYQIFMGLNIPSLKYSGAFLIAYIKILYDLVPP